MRVGFAKVINTFVDYQKHHDLIIECARNRELEGYRERHHVVPRCLGGTNDSENIVELTPEEHYVVHQLLVKMYPKHTGLVYAAMRMTHHSTSNRTNNKVYGWLRRRYSKIAKARTGMKNGSYGSCWVYNDDQQVSKKIAKNELNSYVQRGWKSGRIMDFQTYNKKQEQRRLRSISKQKQKDTYFSEKLEEAKFLYEIYVSEGFTSLREFSRSKYWDKSHVYLTMFFKKYLPDYKSIIED